MCQVEKVTCVGVVVLSVLLVGCTGVTPDPGGSTLRQTSALSISQATSTAQNYSHIEMLMTANSSCTVVPQGDHDSTHQLNVGADEDGIVSFFGVPVSAADTERYLSLACQAPSGAITNINVDLASSSTFDEINPALLPTRSAATVRPSLTDPENYSDLYLIQNGYGLRPDATKQSDRYAQWLADIAKPAKFVSSTASIQGHHSFTQSFTTDPAWGGMELNQSGVIYESNQANYQVPQITKNSSVPYTVAGMWTGLGGVNSDVALIQDGLQLQTSGISATITPFFQYAGGTGTCQASDCLITTMNVHVGDAIRVPTGDG